MEADSELAEAVCTAVSRSVASVAKGTVGEDNSAEVGLAAAADTAVGLLAAVSLAKAGSVEAACEQPVVLEVMAGSEKADCEAATFWDAVVEL
jgi:hypothetical protein